MAHIKDGKLSGLIGEVVGYELNGKECVRKAPQRLAPPTEAELKNRFVLELLSQWLKPLTPFLRKGFRNYSWNFEGFSAAFSVNYREALEKNGFESTIDVTRAKLSSGNLGLPSDLAVVLSPENNLEFSWTPAVNSSQSPRDRIMMLAYNPENGQAIYELSGAIRYQGHDHLSLSEAQPGSFHLYAAFAAEDGSRQSESQYLGTFVLT